jgi:hypothetical protein
MSDETTLRKKAREAMQAGKLPGCIPPRMWGGPGVGACCTICGRPAQPDEVELEFARDGHDRHPGNHHVHVQCFAAWEFEYHHNLPIPGNDRMIAGHEGDETEEGESA